MSLSRRSFLKGVGALAAAAGLAPVAKLVPPVVPALPEGFHPEKVKAIYLAQRHELELLNAGLISRERAMDLVMGPGHGPVDIPLLRQWPEADS